jgi:amidase
MRGGRGAARRVAIQEEGSEMITRRRFVQSIAASAALTLAPSRTSFAANDTEVLLDSHDSVGLAELIKRKEISPRELMEASIRRIERFDGRINAFVARTFDRALEASKTMDLTRPFAGVPFAVKDTTDVAGVPTTFSSAFLANSIPTSSSALVEAYERAGLVILGKTNMSEFGLTPTTESKFAGLCRNPWNLDHSVGGSSGGAAAAVAAGYFPAAHAADGGGSIRIPAACCGSFGLKPTRYRMIGDGPDAPNSRFVTNHCVSRSVRDSAHLLHLTQDSGAGAPLPPIELVRRPAERRLSIGLVTRNYHGKEPRADVRAEIESTAKLCESLGHGVQPLELPIEGEEFEHHFISLFSQRHKALRERMEKETSRPIEESGLMERFTIAFSRLPDARGPDAVEKATQTFARLSERMAAMMAPVDVLLLPVTPTPAPRLGELVPDRPYEEVARRVYDFVSYTSMSNIFGLPAMSVPLGTSTNGLPIASQFVGRSGAEALLLGLAYELEAARPWASRRAAGHLAATG